MCEENLNYLVAFSEGKLFGEDRRRLLAHLRDCSECWDTLMTGMDIYNQYSDELLKMPPPESFVPDSF